MVGEISLSRLALHSNFDASVETYKCSCSNMQVHSVRQITTAVCLRVFCHFLCLASDECSEATNWTADHACWMAYVSASNDPPVAARWQGRRRRGTAIWHVNVPESLLFATLWSSVLLYKCCGDTNWEYSVDTHSVLIRRTTCNT